MRKAMRWMIPALVGVVAVALLVSAPPRAVSTDGVSAPAYGVRLEHQTIPMKDGVRLAVTLYMPDGAKAGEKFPPILEYLPYRKDDDTFPGDYALHSYFAHHGFVGARVDIRGTGQSEGQTPDREYSQQEQQDGLEVIDWLSRQPWSNGSVGMMGISWGGFNSLQIAMRHPPALKAIIATCATEKLFHDDVHFIDGMMHIDQYELAVDLQIAMTPGPNFPLDEKTLEMRFDNLPWFLNYKRHQRDGEFWDEPERPLDSIQIPVFLIGGFYDGYRDSVPRMLEQIKSPMRAIVGPWNHNWPNSPDWGPAIEWRDIAVRWWNQWLKGENTHVMDGPRLAVYMRHAYAPELKLAEIPGEWRSEEGWPPRGLQPETLYPQPDHSLAANATASGMDNLKYVPSVGFAGSSPDFWWGELTIDQDQDDKYSLVYETAPLTEDKAILGFPKALLQASATAPLGNWFVRLSDVAPDGAATMVTGAGLSGAQRDSARNPTDLEPGREYPLQIEMHFTSWVFPRGHKIRLAVSNALWPMIWPTPYAMTTALRLGGNDATHMILPVVPLDNGLPRPVFQPPEPSDRAPGVHGAGDYLPGELWTKTQDGFNHVTRLDWWDGKTFTEFPWGKTSHQDKMHFEVQDAHSETASFHGVGESTVELPGRDLLWRDVLDFRSDKVNFYYDFKRELYLNGQLIREKSWQATIPRDHQ
ncbi:MAG: CocE/NonD family hydrolase [Candidatus Acidiferrales bacterium]